MKYPNIEDIISSYQLPQNIKQKITQIAKHHIEKYKINNFSQIYEYVAELVDKFTVPWEEKNTVSLDQSTASSKRTLHEKITSNNSAETERLEEKIKKENTVSTNTSKDQLKKIFSESDITTQQIISVLLEKVPQFHIPQIAAADIIKNRTVQLLSSYFKYGRLQIPPRPIKHIKFDNKIDIHYAKRRYGGNPLAFLKEHEEFYAQLTRSQLEEIDRGLYAALLRKHQIQEAFELNLLLSTPLYRGHKTALEFFIAHKEKYHGLSRTELQKIDSGLYQKLLKEERLNQLILPKRNRWLHQSPLAYFLSQYEINKDISRTELRKRYCYLYNRLKKENQLSVAIPKKKGNNYHGYETPLAYFLAQSTTYQGLTRSQLQQKDMAMYMALWRAKQIEAAIPENHKNEKKPYRGFDTPLDYYLANQEKYVGISRTQLKIKDSGLHKALKKQNWLDQTFPSQISI